MGKDVNFNMINQKQKDEIKEKILSKKLSIKQIAKQYSVNVGNINKFAKQLNIHGCKAITTSNIDGNISIVEVPVSTIDSYDEIKKEGEILKTEKIGCRGNRYTEDQKLDWIIRIEQELKDGTFRKAEFCERMHIATSTLMRLCKEYNLSLPDERAIRYVENKEEEMKKLANKKKVSKNKAKLSATEIAAEYEEITEEAAVIMDIIPDDSEEIIDTVAAKETTPIIEETTTNETMISEKELLTIEEEAAEKILLSDIDTSINAILETEIRGNLVLIHPARTQIDPILKVGLISNRHNMPTGKYIFHTLSTEELSNYEELYIRAINFIERNIPFIDKVPTRSIDLYVTGAVMVNVAVIKACLDRKVNLNMYHYNPNTGKYNCQTVLSGFPENKGLPDNIVYDFFNNDSREKNFTIFGINSLDEIQKHDKFYIVRNSFYNNPYSKPKSWETCVTKTLDDAFLVYSRFVSELMASKTAGLPLCNTVQISELKYNPEGTVIFGDAISFSNFGKK